MVSKISEERTLVLLHCLQCPPQQFTRSANLTELADERGYIVVAPMGVNLHGCDILIRRVGRLHPGISETPSSPDE